MASTTMQDPRSTQARSAWIAGLTEACNKITSILDMGTASFEDMPLIEDRPTEDDVRRIYISQLGNKLWLSTPRPIIKLNGNEITELGYDYTIDYLGGSIVFEGEFRPDEGDRITASATYIKGGSTTIEAINEKMVELDNKAAKNYKGYYGTIEDLNTSGVSGEKGDYVIIESTNDIYVWNDSAKQYKPTYKVPDLSDYYTIAQTNGLLDTKQNNIIAHGNTNESDAFYYGGRKTWINLYSMVLSTAVKGIVFTDDSTILETDSILKALGKLQAQITGKLHPITGNGAPTSSTVGLVGQDYINLSNGSKYHLVSIETDGTYTWEKYADVSNVMTVDGGGVAKLNGDFGEPPYEFEFTPDTDTHVNSFNGRTGTVVPKSGDYTADMVGAVPTSRTVNSKALSADITLTASDVNALPITGGTLQGTLTMGTSTTSYNIVIPKLSTYALYGPNEDAENQYIQIDKNPTSKRAGIYFSSTSGGPSIRCNLRGIATPVQISDATPKDYVDGKITYGTADLTAGSSSLTTGSIYLVYE